MSTKQERLQFFMKDQGITQKHLADSLGITRANISNYINGNVEIPGPTALAIKAEYNLNPDWLNHGIKPMYLDSVVHGSSPGAEKLVKNYHKLTRPDFKQQLIRNSEFLLDLDGKGRQNRLMTPKANYETLKSQDSIEFVDEEGFFLVHYLGKTAAGTPIELPNPDHWDGSTIQVPKDYFGRKQDPKNYYVLRVSGDSMIDEGIFDEDYVLIEYKQVAHNKQIVVAIVNDEATLKKLHLEPQGIVLRTGNVLVPPIHIENAEQLQIRGIFIKNLGRDVLEIQR